MKEILNTDNIIPVSAGATMSADTADFNNDLYMDIYMVGISSFDSETDGQKNPCLEIKSTKEKQLCERNVSMRHIIWGRDITQCVNFKEGRDKKECMIMITMLLAWESNQESLCGKIPQEYKIQKQVCHNFFAPSIKPPNYEKSIFQINGNILLQGSKEGIFKDVAPQKGADDGYWSWNAKFADLDNDEWQDIYVANGFLGRYFDTRSNIFFHNYHGERFTAEQKEFGLDNYNVVNAYTYIDIDNDGDLDIIAVPVNGPLNIYVNNENKNNSIAFEFRDKKGNSFGIGNKIYIYYGENNER
ncbi:MAG: VCBS repeat-containing protein, partial [bacterium]|nr:VCBS repeat-containing protein [bacterium]